MSDVNRRVLSGKTLNSISVTISDELDQSKLRLSIRESIVEAIQKRTNKKQSCCKERILRDLSRTPPKVELFHI